MRFWAVSVWNVAAEGEERFRVAGPKHHTAKTIRDTLREVHPEWQRIKLRRIKRPSWWDYGEK